MADEIKVQLSVSVANGNHRETLSPGRIEIDQAAIGLAGGVQTIGTSAEAVALGDVSTLGLAYFRNLDATNFVKIGPDSGGTMIDMVKLKPGEYCWLRLVPGITLKAVADTAAVKLEYRIFED